MNYNPKPTLEHIALIHVTATLWNKHDIRFLLTKFSNSRLFSQMDSDLFLIPSCHSERKDKWQTFEDRVKEKVPQLIIPTILKEKILSYVQPVGLQILRWMEYHRESCCFDLDLPYEFYWTPQGTIDRKKTAAVLIKDESINITTRYKLACIYCLEDDIPKLWNEIPRNLKKCFYDEENPSKIEQQELVVLWTYFIKGETAKMEKMIKDKYNRKCSSYRYAFKCAADDGNREATKYFLNKLTSRKKSLVKTAIYVAKKRRDCYRNSTDPPKEYQTDVLCFLLSQMKNEQQIEVFKSRPFDVLKSFLDWPWQQFFVETANHLWNFLPENFYNLLLRVIIHKVIDGFNDYNYQEMFEKMWRQIPNEHKSFVINDSSIAGLIYMLLEIKDKENIKLIFQSASPIEKKNLIFSDRGRFICEDIIYCDEWELLKFFIQICISSKDEIMKFKQEFQEHILPRHLSDTRVVKNNDKWEVFYQLLDDFASGFDKRKSSEGDDNSPAKRLCS